jgi:hypothetical protein
LLLIFALFFPFPFLMSLLMRIQVLSLSPFHNASAEKFRLRKVFPHRVSTRPMRHPPCYYYPLNRFELLYFILFDKKNK